MKLNKVFLAAGMFAVALTSCTNLDVTPDSQYTEDPSKNSGIDPMIMVEAKMSDVYFHLSGTLGRRYMEAQCLASDEFTSLAFDGGYYDSGTYAHQALHDSKATDASLDWYSEITSGITKANTILEELGSGASTQMTAPARAMRAYFTWMLMDSFGDAPILEKVPAEGEVVARSPRKEVAEWIESELTEIIPSLTEDVTANTYGRWQRLFWLSSISTGLFIQLSRLTNTMQLLLLILSSTIASLLVTRLSIAVSSIWVLLIICISSLMTMVHRLRTLSMPCPTTFLTF